MYSAGAKQPNDPDKAWLILLGSLLFVVLIVCAVWYARVLDCPWPPANCDAHLRRRPGVNFARRNLRIAPKATRAGTVVSLRRS
jgi:hypothetical protein